MKLLYILIFFATFSYALTLQEAYKNALKNDVDTKIRENDLIKIKYDLKVSEASNLPTINLKGKIETNKLTQDSLRPDSNKNHQKTDEYEVNLKQSIYNGFGSTYDKKVQEYRYKSAKYYVDENKNQLALKFTQSYIDMLKQKDALSLYKESFLVSQNIFNKVRKKYISGLGTKLEYEEAKGNFDENKVNLSVQKINYKNAYENLKYYLQKDFDTNDLIKPVFYYEIPKNLKQALFDAFIKHPSLIVAKQNLQVAKYEQKRDKKNFQPSVDFVSSYKVSNVSHASDDEYNEYKLGLELNYNLYNGGKDKALNKKALQQIKEKQYLIKETKKQIENKLRLAWVQLKLYEKKLANLKNYVYSKQMVVQATQKEFDLGFKDLNTLLDEQVEYIDVKKDLINTSYDLLLTKYRVLEAIGTLNKKLEKNSDINAQAEQEMLANEVLTQANYTYNDDNSLQKDDIINKIPKELIIRTSTQNKKTNEDKTKKELINKNIKTKTITKEKTFEQRFLSAPKNYYTISLASTKNALSAQNFIQEHKLTNNSLYFLLDKKREIYVIVMGIYKTRAKAIKAINSLSKELKANKPMLQKIFRKQNQYNKHNVKNEITQKKIQVIKKPKIIKKSKVIKKEKNHTKYKNFKQKFLNANKDYYTINLALAYNKKNAERFIKRNKIENNSFYFSFNNKKHYYKIMLGIYKTKNEAIKNLNTLSKTLKANKPRIEKISIKQNLYHKYHGSKQE